MTTRLRTFREFRDGTLIVHNKKGGVNIICKRGAFVVLETSHMPYNSKETKKRFLLTLYFKKMLCDVKVSTRIQRMEGFEWLGKRVWMNTEYVVVDRWEAAHREHGDMQWVLKIYPCYPSFVNNMTHPVDVLENQVKVL